MKNFLRLLIITLLLLVPTVSSAAVEYDLGVTSQNIFFSSDPLYAGSPIRVYANVLNFGQKDVFAKVNFFQGNVLIGQSQTVSVRAGGPGDDVFVDWTVPSGPFNIRVEIVDQDPGDDVSGNDVAISPLITPLHDQDQDGAEDDEDNCPIAYNPDQADNDHDGQGDVCDNDDDNDGVSDLEELEVGTDPFNGDTDGDGVSDFKDAYPTDPTKSAVPPPVPLKKIAPKSVPATVTPETAGVPDGAIDSEGSESELSSDNKFGGLKDFFKIFGGNGQSADGARDMTGGLKIVAKQLDWNTYIFSSNRSDESQTVYRWDFGDGILSTERQVTHDFKPGRYQVELTTRDRANQVTQTSYVVDISFFNFGNWQVWLILAILLLLILLALWSSHRIGARGSDRSPLVIGPFTLITKAKKRATKKTAKKSATKK